MTGQTAEPGKNKAFNDYRTSFERYLRTLVFSNNPQLAGLVEAMRYSLLSGGDRIRPTLCMATAEAFGTDPAHVLPSSAAIELVHTYSLVHDDLPAISDDNYRGGRLTTHKKYGEAMAILVGDAFFGEAMRIIAAHQEGGCVQVQEVLRELAYAAGVEGIVGGQAIDTTRTGVGEEVGTDALLEAHHRKTGALTEASSRIGAILAGADQSDRQAVSEYARELGLCSRIIDDIRSTPWAKDDLGKSVGREAGRGKVTFVGVYGPEGARRAADAAADRALAVLTRMNGDTSSLRHLTSSIHYRTR